MKNELKNFINDYVEGIKITVEEELENNNYYGFDYLDEIEDILKENDIEVNNEDLQQIKDTILQSIIKEYGEDNIYYGSPEHTVSLNGQFTAGKFYWIDKYDYENNFDIIKEKILKLSKYKGVSACYILIKSDFLSYKICIGKDEVINFLDLKKNNYRFCGHINKFTKYKNYYYVKIRYDKNLIAKAEDFMGNLMMSGITDENMLQNLISNWYSKAS